MQQLSQEGRLLLLVYYVLSVKVNKPFRTFYNAVIGCVTSVIHRKRCTRIGTCIAIRSVPPSKSSVDGVFGGEIELEFTLIYFICSMMTGRPAIDKDIIYRVYRRPKNIQIKYSFENKKSIDPKWLISGLD
jgi:hypothetical protein